MANYNINAVTRRVVYSGSAGLGPYSFSFEILVQTDVAVYFNATLLTLTTDYTVTINANGTGSVTIVTGTNVPSTPTASDQIAIVGARDIERTTDFVTAGELRAAALNEQLDGLTIFDQQLLELTDRALTAPITDPTSINMTLPARDVRKGKYLAFNATTGDPEAGAGNDDIAALASITNDIARLADIEDGTLATDAIQTVSANSANVTAVAGNASNINTVAGNNSNISSVASNSTNINSVASNSSNINAVATNISNVNTVAGNSTNINTVAGDSSTISSVASNSTNINAVATNIANVNTVAGNNANITTVAGISADITTVATNVTDVTNFADVYVGPSASDPTTRSDSSSLQVGDLYFNTSSNALKIYNGASWIPINIPTITSVSSQANSATDFLDLPSGTTAQRGSPSQGSVRYNTDDAGFEGYNGSAWAPIGGGNETDEGIWVHSNTISANYSIPSGSNGLSAAPVTVASGVTVTVPSGSVWTLV